MGPFLHFSVTIKLKCKQHEIDDQLSAKCGELKRSRPDIDDVLLEKYSTDDLHGKIGAGFEVKVQGTIFFKEQSRPSSTDVERDGQTVLDYSFKPQPMFTVFASKDGTTLPVRCSKCRTPIGDVRDYLRLSEGQRDSAVKDVIAKHLQAMHADIDPACIVL